MLYLCINLFEHLFGLTWLIFLIVHLYSDRKSITIVTDKLTTCLPILLFLLMNVWLLISPRTWSTSRTPQKGNVWILFFKTPPLQDLDVTHRQTMDGLIYWSFSTLQINNILQGIKQEQQRVSSVWQSSQNSGAPEQLQTNGKWSQLK